MQEIADRINRAVPEERARVRFEGEVPFGEKLRVQRWTLGNGLRVLTLVDKTAPVISYQTWFRVGSRHETKGKTGLAHFFEHLMFNETENLPKGEFDRRLETAGGETNAATWVDWTYYHENVPASELGLAISLEAERMAHLVLREPQVASEREVVANERRYRVDDDVEGATNERLYATAFTRHPYHWPTIGWMQDIERYTPEDCVAFYRTFYAPNNATVVIAGDLDPASALAAVSEHYGKIDAAALPSERKVREPEQTRERRLKMEWPTPTEKLQLGYRGPAFGEYRHTVLTVANELLFGGRSSRLYRALVSEGEIAAEARGSISPFQHPGLYEIWVSTRPGRTAKEALRVLESELARLGRERVSDEELDKAKNRLELGFLEALETAHGKADQIGFYDTVLGDPSLVFSRLAELRRVTADEIRDAVRTTFRRQARTTIVVEPSGETAEEGEAPPRSRRRVSKKKAAKPRAKAKAKAKAKAPKRTTKAPAKRKGSRRRR